MRPVPDRWPLATLAATRVAAPVASAVGAAWGDQASWLLGKVKHQVASVAGLPLANGTCHLRYYRSPGALALVVVVMTNDAATAGARMDVTITLRDAAGADTGAATLANTYTQLDGSTPVLCSDVRTRVPTAHERVFDVSGLTVGTAYEIRVVTATNGGSASRGVYRVAAFEVPRAQLDPETEPSTEPGVNRVWTVAGNAIFAGTASTTADAGAGLERIVYGLDQARAQVRRFPLNICTLEDATNAWAVTSAVYADLPWGFTGTGTTPRFVTRAKRLYATGTTTNALTARVRYVSAVGAKLKVQLTRASDGATTEIVCADSASWAEATASTTIKTDGTDQEDAWTIQAKADVASYVGAISVVDAES